VLATHSPFAGELGLALRGFNALRTGAFDFPGTVAAIAPPISVTAIDADDALINSRLVNFMAASRTLNVDETPSSCFLS
jgi:hypothetical protein